LSYYYAKTGGGGPLHKETLITGWDAASRKQLFRRRRQGMEAIAVSSDARVLAAQYPPVDPESLMRTPLGGNALKRAIRLENLTTGEPLLTLPPPEGRTSPLAFSPDSRLLASHDYVQKRRRDSDPTKTGENLRVWEVATATELLSLPADRQYSAAFSHDGGLLAMAAPLQEIVVWDLAHGRELRRFKGFAANVTSLAFTPDGRRLISGLADSTLLVWEVGPPATPPERKFGADDVAKAWADLAGNDAARAFGARWELGSAPAETISLLKERFRPARAADKERLRQLLADLDNKDFAAREQAQKELAEMAELAAPALRQTLTEKPSLELRRRIEALLAKVRGPVTRPETLRAVRAVAVLEDIATPEARNLLQALARGAPEARVSQEAKAALHRLATRTDWPSR